MDCKQKRMGIVGCFGQIENIKRQSLYRPQEASLLWKLPEGKKGKGQEAEPNGRLASMCRCCNLTDREECEVGFF